MTTQSVPIEAASTRKPNRWSIILGAIGSVGIIGIALWFLHRELAGLSFSTIVGHIKSLSIPVLLAATGFAVCSYAVLVGYDVAALRYVGRKLPYRLSALTSFMANAVGHNVGVATLSGGSIRYRMYTLAGLSTTEIARLVVFVTATFLLGASGLLGIALLAMPDSQTAILSLPHLLVRLAGALLLAIPVVYVASAFLRRPPIQFNNWSVALPPPGMALSQIGIAIADLTFAAATLYVLLEPSLHIGFVPFLGIYLLALAAGLISSVPGGIGVFEAVLVAALPQVDPGALLGTIIVYRLIYYVAPLTMALSLLAGHEFRQHGQVVKRSAEQAGDWLTGIAPQAIGTMVFLAGAVLLISGANPAIESRLAIIAQGMPLPVLELSHLAGSVAGLGLLILARGLFRRLKTAYVVALVVLVFGMGLSLLKGLDYEEAILLGIVAILLWSSRAEFYRRGSVAMQRFSAQWIAAIIIVLSLTLWIGLVSFRQVPYSDVLWWQFAVDAEAPRMLRAILVVAVTVSGFALWNILRSSSRSAMAPPLADEGKLVREVLAGATDSSANVALLGDKRFLWSADQKAFIMYQVSGNSWIAFGGPVGPASHYDELAWAFRELADEHNGRTVFYQVDDTSLSLYVDLGLSLSKLGEEAVVPLSGFSLQGSHRAELRQADNRAKKQGATFSIAGRAEVPAILPELRRVSDSWLAEKSTAEKGFSLGSFSEDYIANFDCAVVRVNEVIVAFANLWTAPAAGELSIDLMRYDRQAPKGVMDYLFVELMLWGAANGYQSFNLGMAPLAGLEKRSLAPLWHKVGHLIFTHGENFYNFEGLRAYKDKFDPQWRPRYLACPNGWWHLPTALLDASRLISGGVTGILGKK